MRARFQKIEQIFLAAVEQQPDQVSAFLDMACEGDRVLRREVEVLLASDEKAGPFIEKSAVGLATKIIGSQQADSLVGQTIGHYKIFESIGAGGMGEVYLATDIVAGRRAALKLLPLRFKGDTERLKRFKREARAVVGLNHPNVVTVYEIGHDKSIHYIASELIDGETLRDRLARGPMKLSEALDVAIQVTSALAAAHQAGIVHRDIKPENIMLRPDGYAKVLDFGIAKLAEQKMPTSVPTDEAFFLVETNLGSVLGTVRYMSPEQARGGQVDTTTDIWSLGVVLYEMVTGHPPFMGDTPKEVMSSILEREPPPLTRYLARAPAGLQQIVSKTLRKDPAQRYHSAHEMVNALKNLCAKVEAELQGAAVPLWLRWARPPAALAPAFLLPILALALAFYWHRTQPTSLPSNKSIAVLPFENLSRDPDNAYFAEGIQEEILTRLANIADLKVISRTSTQRYQSKPRNLSQIAKQLGVANVLEGSVQKVADQIRVNVQLINAQTDSHLWADTYDRKVNDIFSVESEVAKRIAESLQAKLTGREERALALKPTNNPEAYDAYLRGLAFEARSNPSLEAANFYERAVQLDPDFAVAWARLSRANAHLYFDQRYRTSDHDYPDAAEDALKNAQRLAPDSPETLLALGYYQHRVLGDNGQAKSTFERVGKMLPSSSQVPRALGTVTRWEGHWDQSIAYFEQALALDPRDQDLLTDAALAYLAVRRFPPALKLYDRALDIMPNDPEAMAEKASIYQAEGNLQQAARLLAQINEQTPNVEAVKIKATQLRLERNYIEAVRLLKTRLTKFHYASEFEKVDDLLRLASIQRLAGDSAGAEAIAEEVRNTLEPLHKNQPNHMVISVRLVLAHAMLGEKALALEEMERIIMLYPLAKDPAFGAGLEEFAASIQTIFGENSRAISTLRQLLQTPYLGGAYYPATVTAALLRIDPIWDPLRSDPPFQELCEEKRP